MNSKRMPKKTTKKKQESDDEQSVESDSYHSETENDINEEVDNEEEEVEESSDTDNVYLETDTESEKDLLDGEVKDEDVCDYDEDENIENKPQIEIAKEDRITRPVLTKYELVRILGTRALQISLGAPVLIKGVESKTPYEIAELEIKNGVCPIIILRPLPDNTYESWRVSELELP